MHGTRPPLTSTNASVRAAVKRAKAGSAFTLDNSDFSLHLLVWFYIAARNLGTTAPKISVFSSVLKGKKFSILKAFHGATAFCGANANTISYNINDICKMNNPCEQWNFIPLFLKRASSIGMFMMIQNHIWHICFKWNFSNIFFTINTMKICFFLG